MEVASGVGSFGRRLTIVNPTTVDMGLYVCEASLLDSSVKPAEARAFLSIIGIKSFFFSHLVFLKRNSNDEQSISDLCVIFILLLIFPIWSFGQILPYQPRRVGQTWQLNTLGGKRYPRSSSAYLSS